MIDSSKDNASHTAADDGQIPPELRDNIFITTLDKIYNWGRKRSMWPLMSGLACCAIKMISTSASRYGPERFGWGWNRPSPRRADLLIVSSTVTKKMAPVIARLYNQMPEPKYVIAMGHARPAAARSKKGTASSRASTS